jgi:predicted Na+-dependent transporter
MSTKKIIIVLASVSIVLIVAVLFAKKDKKGLNCRCRYWFFANTIKIYNLIKITPKLYLFSIIYIIR